MDPVDAIYLRRGPGNSPIVTVLDTTMDGQSLDPEAPVNSTITELGLEREGLRGDWLTINAKYGYRRRQRGRLHGWNLSDGCAVNKIWPLWYPVIPNKPGTENINSYKPPFIKH